MKFFPFHPKGNNPAPASWILRYQHEDDALLEIKMALETTKEIIDFQHPDLLILGKDPHSAYKVEQLDEFFDFIKFSPLEWNQKWAIFLQAQNMSSVVANKLLKSLEEPPAYLSMGLLAKSHAHLLPTIESRSISIFCPAQTQWSFPPHIKSWPELFGEYLKEYPEQRSWMEALWRYTGGKSELGQVHSELIAAGEEKLDELLTATLTYLCKDPELLDQYLSWEKWARQSRIYNNPSLERVALGLELWQKIVRSMPQGPGQ